MEFKITLRKYDNSIFGYFLIFVLFDDQGEIV